MTPTNPEADKLIEKRREVNQIGQLRREKMIVMKVGERRARKKVQPEQPGQVGKIDIRKVQN